MATPLRRLINHGTQLNDPNAESVFEAFQKTEINFGNLWEMTKNQGYELFFLDLLNVDTTKSELDYISDAIMQSTWSINVFGRQPLFYTVTPTTGGPTIQQNTLNYRYYRVHKKGQFFGGQNVITPQDVSPAGSLSINQAENTDMFIFLGDIGSQNIWTAFNLGDNGAPWNVVGLKFVSAKQNGNDRVWVFIGNQRLGLDEGDWGGSNTTDPNYLAATEEDFNLVTNQPVVTPDLFVTKSSNNWVDVEVNATADMQIDVSQEQRCLNVVTNVDATIIGLKPLVNTNLEEVVIYDGLEIIIKNNGANTLKLTANDSAASIPFELASDLFIPVGELYQFKYNKADNSIERVGAILNEDKPVPFGKIKILKIESNIDPNALEVGDRVVRTNLNNNIYLSFGEYVGGDPMDVSSYDQATIDYFDPQNP